jgi:glycosyltransferase involved in cell wall biosynthesis
MKIIITHEFPFEKKYYGGGNQIVEGLSCTLFEQGNEIHVFTTGKGELVSDKLSLSISFHYIFPYVKNFSGIILGIFSILKIIKLKPDLIICFTSECAFVSAFGRLLNYKVYAYQAAPEYPDFSKMKILNKKKKIGLYLQYLGAKYSTRVLSISKYSSNLMIKNWNLNPNKIKTVGVGLNNIYLDENVRIKKNRKENLKLISIGRIVFDQKPFDILPDIIKDFIDKIETWIVIGDGPDLSELKKKVNQLNLGKKVIFRGTLGSEDIKKELLNSDIALLPSNYESFFLTVYESAAMSTVVITNEVADIREYFDKIDSILISPIGEKNDFKEKLIYTIENFDELQKIANDKSNQIQKDFDWTNISKNFIN